MRLLACAAHNEDIVLAADCVIQGAFQQHIAEARVHLPHSAYANAWAAGQLLTLSEARAWLASLPGLIAPRTEIST
jgi:hypothetical protein